jgi:hypothetical protein
MTYDYDKLVAFFKEVASLTSNHDGIHFQVMNGREEQISYDVAVVYPSKLGPALEKVDPEWWKHTGESNDQSGS